ncbi:sulfate permease family protein [Staphylococcus haemolyticus]|nr:sulfate permease family protein [Staphylococcus haemolyticus]
MVNPSSMLNQVQTVDCLHLTAGIVLIFMIIVLGGLVVQVPMPILAGNYGYGFCWYI